MIHNEEFSMKKIWKILLGTIATVFAGLGIYNYISTRRNGNTIPDDAWTADDIPDLGGKVIIVTGANSGTGYEAARQFARKGARTILACRSMDKAQAAAAHIQAEIPKALVDVMLLDLSNLQSVREFAEVFKAKYDRLDVLVNNAGIMMVPYGVTQDGFERQFGTNHLGHFALTCLLLDLIEITPGARVVNVSSLAHHSGEMDFDNLMFEGGLGYERQAAYGRSKLANLLFTYELERRFDKYGLDAMAVAAHPGISNTNLADHIPGVKILKPILGGILQSAAMGALPIIRAAVDTDANGGQYYGPDGKNERGGFPVVVSSSEASHNQADAQKLWEVSEELTGITFNPLNEE
jgi:NAD(P)-dependent dehydrogenase (short-subunit alcohol dehydrogenase family)